ncbi:hypothetical protein GCM10011608_60690 [Micromonospora sonchi]|uniref:Uncharacterized protein n=1 Tax=Micromonospora sonchi TaxID=1763543 RepID=A0A917U9I9_9ACTN|nr:hypothetical protein [Micromonospora sonchi]GGM67263.1 hypothetical protein GCM10011608_60690 [Micromonospora sonchi]
MPHWTNWAELGSWFAAIIGTLVGVFTAVQASNTFRMKATLDLARPFVRALALSLDKPDILAAYESECTTAGDILRKKTRRMLVVAGLAFALLAMGVGGTLLSRLPEPPNRTEIRFSVGDAAQQECETTGLGWVMSTTCTNRWFLDSSGQRIQAEATLSGPARQRNLGIVVDGCSGRAQVRWELLADGKALGNGMAGSGNQEQELNVPKGKSSLTIRAERIDDNSCSAELVVEAVQWP